MERTVDRQGTVGQTEKRAAGVKGGQHIVALGCRGTPAHRHTRSCSPPRSCVHEHTHMQMYPHSGNKGILHHVTYTSILHTIYLIFKHFSFLSSCKLLEGKEMNFSFSFKLCSQRRVMLPRIVFQRPRRCYGGSAGLQRVLCLGQGSWVLPQLPHEPAGWPTSPFSLDLSFLFCWKVKM